MSSPFTGILHVGPAKAFQQIQQQKWSVRKFIYFALDEDNGLTNQEALVLCSWAFCNGNEPNQYWKELYTKLGTDASSCASQWSPGSQAYRCMTCQLDPTCAICVPCFQNGNHKGHDYGLITTAGGCCDCGDPQAWKPSGFCKDHAGTVHALSQDLETVKQLESGAAPAIPPYQGFKSRLSPSDKVEDEPETTPATFKDIVPEPYLRPIYTTLSATLEVLADSLYGLMNPHDVAEARFSILKRTVAILRWLTFIAEKRIAGIKRLLSELFYRVPGLGSFILDVRINGFPDFSVSSLEKLKDSIDKFAFVMLNDIRFKFGLVKEFIAHYKPAMQRALMESSVEGLSVDEVKERRRHAIAARTFLEELTVQLFTVPALATTITKSNGLETILTSFFTVVRCASVPALPADTYIKNTRFKQSAAVTVIDDDDESEPSTIDIIFGNGTGRNGSVAATTASNGRPPQPDVIDVDAMEENERTSREMVLNKMDAEETEDEVLLVVQDTKDDLSRRRYYQNTADMRYLLNHVDCAVRFLPSAAASEVSPSTTPFVLFLRVAALLHGSFPWLREIDIHVETEDVGWLSTFGLDLELMHMLFVAIKKLKLSQGDHTGVWRAMLHLTIPRLIKKVSADGVNRNVQPDASPSSSISFSSPSALGFVFPLDFSYYVLSQVVSFHLPLHRTFATAVHEAIAAEDVDLQRLLPLEQVGDLFAWQLVEHTLRLQVLLGQVYAGLWRRNGRSLVACSAFYRTHFHRDFGYALDLFNLQLGAILLGPDGFLKVAANRFGLESFFSLSRGELLKALKAEQDAVEGEDQPKPRRSARRRAATEAAEPVAVPDATTGAAAVGAAAVGGNTEAAEPAPVTQTAQQRAQSDRAEARNVQVKLIEYYLSMVLILLTDRTHTGLSDAELVRRDIVHRLAVGDQTHSQLIRTMSKRRVDHPDFESILKEVASFQPPRDSREQGSYRLKIECWVEIEAYYPHYSKNDAEKMTERYQNQRQSTDSKLPPLRPRLLPTYNAIKGLNDMLRSPTLLHYIKTILSYAAFTDSEAKAEENGFSDSTYVISDVLLGHTLNLLYLIATEQDKTHHAAEGPTLLDGSLLYSALAAKQGEDHSVIELLLRLRKSIMEAPDQSSGDHQFVIETVLRHVASRNGFCRDSITATAPQLVPGLPLPSSTETMPLEQTDKEKRKEMMKARQEAILKQMQAQQKMFLMDVDEGDDEVTAAASSSSAAAAKDTHGGAVSTTTKTVERPVYQCALCHEEGHSTTERPFGLMTLSQRSRLLGSANEHADSEWVKAIFSRPLVQAEEDSPGLPPADLATLLTLTTAEKMKVMFNGTREQKLALLRSFKKEEHDKIEHIVKDRQKRLARKQRREERTPAAKTPKTPGKSSSKTSSSRTRALQEEESGSQGYSSQPTATDAGGQVATPSRSRSTPHESGRGSAMSRVGVEPFMTPAARVPRGRQMTDASATSSSDLESPDEGRNARRRFSLSRRRNRTDTERPADVWEEPNSEWDWNNTQDEEAEERFAAQIRRGRAGRGGFEEDEDDDLLPMEFELDSEEEQLNNPGEDAVDLDDDEIAVAQAVMHRLAYGGETPGEQVGGFMGDPMWLEAVDRFEDEEDMLDDDISMGDDGSDQGEGEDADHAIFISDDDSAQDGEEAFLFLEDDDVDEDDNEGEDDEDTYNAMLGHILEEMDEDAANEAAMNAAIAESESQSKRSKKRAAAPTEKKTGNKSDANQKQVDYDGDGEVAGSRARGRRRRGKPAESEAEHGVTSSSSTTRPPEASSSSAISGTAATSTTGQPTDEPEQGNLEHILAAIREQSAALGRQARDEMERGAAETPAAAGGTVGTGVGGGGGGGGLNRGERTERRRRRRARRRAREEEEEEEEDEEILIDQFDDNMELSSPQQERLIDSTLHGIFDENDVGLHMLFCGHAAHMHCWQEYHSSLVRSFVQNESYKGEQIIDLENGELLCPLCGRLTNALAPITDTTPEPPSIQEEPSDKAADAAAVEPDMSLSESWMTSVLNRLLESERSPPSEGSTAASSSTASSRSVLDDTVDTFSNALFRNLEGVGAESLDLNQKLSVFLSSVVGFNIASLEVQHRGEHFNVVAEGLPNHQIIDLLSVDFEGRDSLKSELKRLSVILGSVQHYFRKYPDNGHVVELLKSIFGLNKLAPRAQRISFFADWITRQTGQSVFVETEAQAIEESVVESTTESADTSKDSGLKGRKRKSTPKRSPAKRRKVDVTPTVTAAAEESETERVSMASRVVDPFLSYGPLGVFVQLLLVDGSQHVGVCRENRFALDEHMRNVLKCSYMAMVIQALKSIQDLECIMKQTAQDFLTTHPDHEPTEDGPFTILHALFGCLGNVRITVHMGRAPYFLQGSSLSFSSLLKQIENFVLPFLRRICLLLKVLTNQPLDLDRIDESDGEFNILRRLLRLPSLPSLLSQDMTQGDPSMLLLVQYWFQQLNQYWIAQLPTSNSRMKHFHMDMNDMNGAFPPIPFSLIELPHNYEDIYWEFSTAKCDKCKSVPTNPAICLVCRTLVCACTSCCRDIEYGECTQHAEFCTGGMGIFLLTKICSVVLLRGERRTFWGSPYLDAHGEEDPQLRRGRPLFLSEPRYKELERLWVHQAMDHDSRVLEEENSELDGLLY